MCALTLSRLDDFSDIIYGNDNNIFGRKAGHFGGKLLPHKYPR